MDFKEILKKMKEYVLITFCSIRKKIDAFNRKFCFEIFGFDFILDINMHLWLIEVNTNPCLEESSSLLKSLMPRMIGIFLFFFFEIFLLSFYFFR